MLDLTFRSAFRNRDPGVFLSAAAISRRVSGLPPVSCLCGQHLDHLTVKKNGKEIVFLVGSDMLSVGSAYLRAFQLSHLVCRFGGCNARVLKESDHELTKVSDAIIVLNKSVFPRVTAAILKSLTKQGNSIWFDQIDGTVPEELEILGAGFICSSVTEHRVREADKAKPNILLPHAADLRMRSTSPHDSNRMRVGYVGSRYQSRSVSGIDNLHFVYTPTSSQAHLSHPRWMRRAEILGIQICTSRKRDTGLFHPPTKLSTAVKCGAKVIASQDDEELMAILGRNYPFVYSDKAAHDEIPLLIKSVANTQSAFFDEFLSKFRSMTCPVWQGSFLAKELLKLSR